jgi:Uma2 family endonuclease
MSRQAERHYTVEDYFAIEESSTVKHEYFGGEIFAMAGASLRHNRITGNVYATLRRRLEGADCEAFSSDLRVRTPGGLYTYPDVLVVCGEVELSDDRLETVTNPALIVEVLSESTKDYDRGQKFEMYQTLPSLREYVMIEQARASVEQFVREGDGAGGSLWTRRAYTDAGERVELVSLGVTLTLDEMYARVSL